MNDWGFEPKSKCGIMGIVHNKSVLSDEDIKFLSEGRLFALSPFQYKGYEAGIFSMSFYSREEISNPLHFLQRVVLFGVSNNMNLVENEISEAKEFLGSVDG